MSRIRRQFTPVLSTAGFLPGPESRRIARAILADGLPGQSAGDGTAFDIGLM